jgi:hypothetical protein
VEYRREDGAPPATQICPFHIRDHIAVTLVRRFAFTAAVQLIPLDEYARTFVPEPPATHIEPFHITQLHWVVKMALPLEDAVQSVPPKE